MIEKGGDNCLAQTLALVGWHHRDVQVLVEEPAIADDVTHPDDLLVPSDHDREQGVRQTRGCAFLRFCRKPGDHAKTQVGADRGRLDVECEWIMPS